MSRENGSVSSQGVITSNNSDVSEAHGLTDRLHDILDMEENSRAGMKRWGEHCVVVLKYDWVVVVRLISVVL